ncbi:histidine phosphatase family protein [Devosia ginsengisoli]|uniref:histidine phosphatase family protein n=1 Tax=Devosia ginsengisoli TaxID=400770 RepID=UPI0026E95FB6|nr:histidine phosphatase family protein [Devosia ginsengisoli]MCR6670086.1 histidine phosphatase family protein [Devosia ginsengisoli]
MTRLILTRHAETLWHAENRYAGRSEIGLTEQGLRQAEALGRWAAKVDLDAIWASPMQRVRATAAPAAQASGFPPTFDARLREVDFGWLEGKTRKEAQAERPAELAAYLENPVDNVFEGAEAPREAVARGRAALDTIATSHEGQRVLIVAHSTLIRLLLCDLLDIPLQRYRQVFPALGNCTLTEIDISNRGTGLITLNIPTYLDGLSHD